MKPSIRVDVSELECSDYFPTNQNCVIWWPSKTNGRLVQITYCDYHGEIQRAHEKLVHAKEFA